MMSINTFVFSCKFIDGDNVSFQSNILNLMHTNKSYQVHIVWLKCSVFYIFCTSPSLFITLCQSSTYFLFKECIQPILAEE